MLADKNGVILRADFGAASRPMTNNPHQNTEAVLQPWLVFNLSADMALHNFYFLLFWRQGFSM